ncbi:hypothetical protein CCAE64S_01038 [Castellaniella caeni]
MKIRDIRNELPGVRLLNAADCEPRAVSWLWNNWLPKEAITILAGAPGTGKTTIALSIAAVASKGGSWPDQSICSNSHNIIIWSGEDDIEATLLPRLISMDANLKNIHFVTQINDGGRHRDFDPSADMNHLIVKLTEIGGAGLIIIDPVISVVAGDSNQAGVVRDGLQVLQSMARFGIAVLGITHFSKSGKTTRSPLERVIGSQAFAALARVVWVTAKGGNENRVFARAKNNLGPDDGGYEYTVSTSQIADGIEASMIRWGDYLEGDAESILNGVEQTESVSSRIDDAKTFLCGILTSEGRVPANDILSRSKQAGHSFSTINRAKKEPWGSR